MVRRGWRREVSWRRRMRGGDEVGEEEEEGGEKLKKQGERTE